MDPINYQAAFPQIDIGRQFLTGVQAGGLLGSIGQQTQQNQLAQQQAQIAQKRAQQYQSDISAAMANPTPQAFSALTLKYPEQHAAVKQAWDQQSEGDKKTEGDTMAQSYSALLAGQPDVAKKIVQTQIDARKNSGLDTSHYDNALAMLDSDPKQAQAALGFTLSHITDPKTFATQFGALGGEQRAQALAPGELEKQAATTAETTTKTAGEKASLIGQTMGSLQGKNATPLQVATAFNSLAAKGVISKDELPIYLNDIPADPKEMESFLNTYKLAGVKPSEQMKFTTPTAGEKLTAETARLDRAQRQAQFEAEQKAANEPAAPNETMAKQIAGYKAAPLGQFSLNKPWGQATMDRVMQLNPDYDAAQYAPRAAALKSYAAGGKESLGIDSINIGMNHIDTLRGLALAQKNGDIKQWNRLANAWATQTGNPAPTNLRMATDMVAPEIVKAVTGVGGTGEERAHFGESLTGKGSYAPDQVLGALDQVQDLFAGRLKEKKRSYERSTKLTNFEDEFLSPTAKSLLQEKGKPIAGASAAGAFAKTAHPADIDQLLSKYGNQ